MAGEDHYDVIIIGSGAGGGHSPAPAPSGKRILLLERGDSGAVNPALAIMANARRVGERILERLG